MVAAVHVLDPHRCGGRAGLRVEGAIRHDGGRDRAPRPRRDPDVQLGLAGHGTRRRGRAPRDPGHVMKLATVEPGRGDNNRVLRWLAKVGINVAITHGLAEHVGSLQPGGSRTRCHNGRTRSSACGRARGEVRHRRLEISGDGNATMLAGADPRRADDRRSETTPAPVAGLPRGVGAGRRAPDLALAGRSQRVPRRSASDMVRNDRRGTVRVDPRTHAVTLDGEPVSAAPVDEPPLSGATCSADAQAAGHLLGDAVDVAAAEQDLAGRHADDLAARGARRGSRGPRCRSARRAAGRRRGWCR